MPMWREVPASSITGMTTHPDVLWELVRERQARLREEAEQYNRASQYNRATQYQRASRLFRRKSRPSVAPRPGRLTTIGSGARIRDAGTLAACAPGVAD
jgi:hypothetical protein